MTSKERKKKKAANFECAMALSKRLHLPSLHDASPFSLFSFQSSHALHLTQQSLKRSAPGEDNGVAGGASVSLVASAATTTAANGDAAEAAGAAASALPLQFRPHQAASKRPRKSMGRRVSFAPDAVLETRHMYALVSSEGEREEDGEERRSSMRASFLLSRRSRSPQQRKQKKHSYFTQKLNSRRSAPRSSSSCSSRCRSSSSRGNKSSATPPPLPMPTPQ